jgi:hypothetical protein
MCLNQNLSQLDYFLNQYVAKDFFIWIKQSENQYKITSDE